MVRTISQSLSVPLRSTPLGFRVLVLVGAVLIAFGYLRVLDQVSGPTPAELLREPGFLLLAALVLLADLYPLIPSMREVRVNITFAWSTTRVAGRDAGLRPVGLAAVPGQRPHRGGRPPTPAVVDRRA